MKADRVLLLAGVVGALLAILGCLPLIALPYQIDYGEGLVLDGALRVRHSQALYPDPFAFPVVLHVYGPVAYVATALFLPGGTPSFPAGRFMVLACSIVLALLVGAILRRLTGSWWIGLAFGLVLLALPAFRFWLYLLRADVIGVVFSTIGIALYVLKEKEWYWSIPFFSLAIFCKYSLLAAPVAVFLHLILNRRVMQGFGFAAATVSACTAGFIYLQVTTDGWFAFHMFSTHPDRYSVAQFAALAALVAASAPVVAVLAFTYVVHEFRSVNPSLPAVYFVISFLTGLTAGKLGSTTNHFIEWMVASCMCAGLGYSWLRSMYPAKAMPIAALLCASVLIGVVAQNASSLQPSRELADCGPVYQQVHDSPSDRILSQSLGPLLKAAKPVLLSDPFVYGQTVKHGLRSDQIEKFVNEKYFGLILMGTDPTQLKLHDNDIWPQSLIAAIARNYRVVNRFSCRDAGVMLEPLSANGIQQDSSVLK